MKYVTVVDDAPDLGRVLQQMMLTISRDLAISVMPSAEEAMLDAGRHTVDLLVTDLRLPGISGSDLVKKFRARHPGVKVIVITGLSDGPVVQQARAANPDYFFYKPLNFPEFLRAASRCLDLPMPDILRTVKGAGRTAPLMAPVGLRGVLQADQQPERLDALVAPGIDAPKETLPDVLGGLRQRLGALAVFVLNDSGRTVAQAGDLPKFDLETDWAPLVFSALGAAEKMARLVKTTDAGHIQAHPGKDFDLVMTSFGPLALLAVLPKGRSALRLALAVEELLVVRPTLLAIFDRMGLSVSHPLPPAAPEAPLEPAVIAELAIKSDPSLETLEKIIHDSSAIQPAEADAYWDSAESSPRPSPSSPDMITYDQAARLGLAPKEGRETPPEH